MLDAYIYDGLRTAFGRHGGVLAPVRPDDMLAAVIRTLIERNPFDSNDYEDVIAGCTNQAGEDARNVARHAGLLIDGHLPYFSTLGAPSPVTRRRGPGSSDRGCGSTGSRCL